MRVGTEADLSPGHIVLDGHPVSPKRGTAPPPSFRPMSIVAKRSNMSATATGPEVATATGSYR